MAKQGRGSSQQWAWALSLTGLTILFLWLLNNMKPGKYVTPYEDVLSGRSILSSKNVISGKDIVQSSTI